MGRWGVSGPSGRSSEGPDLVTPRELEGSPRPTTPTVGGEEGTGGFEHDKVMKTTRTIRCQESRVEYLETLMETEELGH